MAKPYTWDLFVRVTHWLVAALFLANFFAIEEGSDLHEWVGYVVMGAIILRLGWGESLTPCSANGFYAIHSQSH